MLLHVRPMEVTGMEPMDTDGGADPYLKVEMQGQKNQLKSRVLAGLNPIFQEEFSLDVACYGTDILRIELWDKDEGSPDDPVGYIQIEVCRLPPGYVVDSIYPLTPMGSCRYPGQMHLILQVAPSVVPRWQPAPFAPLMLRVNIFEARDIAKMDTFGKTDAFCVVKIKGSVRPWETKVIDNSMTPVWNETHDFIIWNPDTEILSILMRDKDPGTSEDMALLELPVSTFKTPSSPETWYNMNPLKKVKKGGQIRMAAQIFQAPPQQFPPTAPGLISSPDVRALTPEQQAQIVKRMQEELKAREKAKKKAKKKLKKGVKGFLKDLF